MLLDIVDEDHCHALVVVLGTASPTHHLEHVCDGVVHVTMRLAIKVLGSLYDNKMGGKVDAPGKSTCCNQDLRELQQDY